MHIDKNSISRFIKCKIHSLNNTKLQSFYLIFNNHSATFSNIYIF